ncbi:MAG TPA: CopG family transcriptional regulator [Fibrobacteres bacterium]|jgi:hypothetical protein|nr:CopG family transcriptional regulator [Fibrobacterota bacterium]
MKAKEFDKLFDDDKDIANVLNIRKASRPGQLQKRVNVDFPVWVIDSLDKEAKRLGVTRQSIIKVWIAEHLSKKIA